MAGTFVAEAASMSMHVDSSKLNELDAQRAEAHAEVLRLGALRKGLLPVEMGAKTGIEQRMTAMRETEEAMEMEVRRMRFSNQWGFPRMFDEPLTWRDEMGMPRLVPFSVTQSTVMFTISEHAVVTINPEVVRYAVAGLWEDVRDRLCHAARSRTRVSYIAQFGGVIPDDVRAVIGQWPASEVFLLAEVDEWVENQTVVPQVDPLVLIRKHRAWWLAAQFDVTPVEQYVADEWTE